MNCLGWRRCGVDGVVPDERPEHRAAFAGVGQALSRRLAVRLLNRRLEVTHGRE